MMFTHDSDRSGKISRDELVRFLHSIHVFLTKAEIERVFAEYDPDGTGVLTYCQLSDTLIPKAYPDASNGHVKSIPEQYFRQDPKPPVAHHIAGCSEAKYKQVLSEQSKRARSPRRKAALPPEARGISRASNTRSKTALGGEKAVQSTPDGTVAQPLGTSRLQNIKQNLRQKRAGMRRLFHYIDTNKKGSVSSADVARALLGIGVSQEDVEWTLANMGLSGISETDSDAQLDFGAFAEFMDGQPDTFVNWFDATCYEHHENNKDRGPRTTATATTALAQIPQKPSAAMNVPAANIGTFEELEVVLRDKVMARSRTIQTDLRRELLAIGYSNTSTVQNVPSTTANGCEQRNTSTEDSQKSQATPIEIQDCLARYGILVSSADMDLLVRRFQQYDGEGSISLRQFVDWILPDDDHDCTKGTVTDGQVVFRSLGPQAVPSAPPRPLPPRHDLQPSRVGELADTNSAAPVWARRTPVGYSVSRKYVAANDVNAVLRDKLLQRKGATPKCTLRFCMKRHAATCPDGLNYAEFRRCLESLGVDLSDEAFVSVVTKYDSTNSGLVTRLNLEQILGL